MLKRVLSVLLLMMLAVGSEPTVEAHSDNPGVIFEWNGLLQSSSRCRRRWACHRQDCRDSVALRCCTSRCSMR